MEYFRFRSTLERMAQTRRSARAGLRWFRTIGLLLGFLPTLCSSQIVPKPEFNFEKLSWGDSLINVKKMLHGHVFREQDSEEQLGAVGAAMPSSLLLSYEDTLKNSRFRIVLWFSKTAQKLTRAIIALAPPNANEDKGKGAGDEDLSSVWDKFSEHYGPSFAEGSIPLIGKSKTWSFPGTDVFMMSVNTFGKRNFTITYSQNRKK